MSLTVADKPSYWDKDQAIPLLVPGLQGDFASFFFKLEKKMRSSLVAKGDFAYELKKVEN